jgi:hypothetical protein
MYPVDGGMRVESGFVENEIRSDQEVERKVKN